MVGDPHPVGALSLGVNPYRQLDMDYREFFRPVGRQIGIALTDTLSYQQERGRAQALADIDRAKTTFFQNVSHELRTPVTLLLAPLQLLPTEPGAVLSDQDRASVQGDPRRAAAGAPG